MASLNTFLSKGLTATNIKKQLESLLRDSPLSNVIVKSWVVGFKMDRTCATNNPRVGGPIKVTMPEKQKHSTKSFWQTIE